MNKQQWIERRDRVGEMLAQNAEAFFKWLYPNARRIGRELAIGDVHGNPGQSLRMDIPTGKWFDFATRKGGRTPLSLLALKRGVRMRDAIAEAERWLGIAGGDRVGGHHKKAAPERAPQSVQNVGRSWGTRPPSRRPDMEYTYTDAEGNTVFTVCRWDTPGGKIIRPRLPDGAWGCPPENRPMWRLPQVMSGREPVVWAEGEKAAAALVEAGFNATTNAQGVQSVAKTDWTPLRDRVVVLWPDADIPGREGARGLVDILKEVGVAAIHMVTTEDLPEKADAADLPVDERRARVENALKRTPVWKKPRQLALSEWHMGAYQGDPPDMEMLVDGLIPFGKPVILAADGGLGKTMLAFQLAWIVAYEDDHDPWCPVEWCGHTVLKRGKVVILTGEDDRDEIHRRLHRVAGERFRDAIDRDPSRLVIVPTLEIDDGVDFFEGSEERGDLRLSDSFYSLLRQLEEIDDLALVVIDPLDAFCLGRTDQTYAARLAAKALALISLRTKATVLAIHHMRKRMGQPVENAEDAREMIRGASALVNGVRGALAMWKCRASDEIKLSVVKANYVHVHDEIVLRYLDDGTIAPLKGEIDEFQEDMAGMEEGKFGEGDSPEDVLYNVIRIAAECGEPFDANQRSSESIGARFHSLPPSMQKRLREWRRHLKTLMTTLDPATRRPSVVTVLVGKRVVLDIATGAIANGLQEIKKSGILEAEVRIREWWSRHLERIMSEIKGPVEEPPVPEVGVDDVPF